MAAKFKLALDDAVPYFMANALSSVVILPKRRPLIRYDMPWEATELPSNGYYRREYEIPGLAELRFEKYLLSLKVQFVTSKEITQAQFDAVLRGYGERLREHSNS